MKTKLFTLCFALIVSIGTMCAKVQIGDLYYELNTQYKTAEVTWKKRSQVSYNVYEYNKGWDIVEADIPSSVLYDDVQYTVTGISEFAFNNCSNLTSVTIPNSITSIGKEAFKICNKLSTLIIGNGVQSIGDKAFEYCDSLVSVTLNASSIVSKNYGGGTGIKDIFGPQVQEYIIGDNIKHIGNYAFVLCENLTSVTISNSVTSIGETAFGSCTNLTSITIPDSITIIDGYTFSGCSNLTTINIPASITSIGEAAFNGCISLSSITLPDSITDIHAWSFMDCSSLATIEIPNSVKTIHRGAFLGCSSLTSVEIPSNVELIESEAFLCENLTSVAINSDKFLRFEVEEDHQKTTFSEIFGTQVTNITIGDEVTGIGKSFFSNCTNVTSIVIGDNVTYIGKEAFYNCTSLASVSIGNGVKSIRESAFKNCTSLASIEYGNKIDSIKSEAFSNCIGLSSIVLPDSIKYIGDYAFNNWNNLSSITIPNGIKEIGDGAFLGWKGSTLEIPSSVEYIGAGAFMNDNLFTVTINSNHLIQYTNNTYDHGDSRFVSGNASAFGSQVKKYILGDDIVAIGKGAFVKCYDLTSIVLPAGIKSIGKSAFEDCRELKSIDIPQSVKTIGDYAFYYCTSLTSVVIPDSVTKLGKSAFAFCENIERITIPASLNSIYVGNLNYSVFSHCDLITELYYTGNIREWCEKSWSTRYLIPNITYDLYIDNKKVIDLNVPNGTTFIGAEAFWGCGSIRTITIPYSITSIGENAFEEAPNLTSITCYATTPPTYTGISQSLCNFNNIILYVPSQSINAYRTAPEWQYFYYYSQILPIGANPIDVSSTTIIPGYDFVEISWQVVNGAATYELVITDIDGNIICTLTFNTEGQLLTIEYRAPGRNGAPQSIQTAGFTYTITGLVSGSTYSYTLIAKNSSGGVLNTESGSFNTSGVATSVNNLVTDMQSSKILRNGQILILRGDKTYTIQGQEVVK